MWGYHTIATTVEPFSPTVHDVTSEAPLHVSLVALIVMALFVVWDRRRHGGHRLGSS